MSTREVWTLIHGVVLGGFFFLAFGAAFAALWSMREKLLTPEGLEVRVRRLRAGLWILAAVCWLTAASGTFIVYPWYRDKSDPQSPRSLLKADPQLAAWHSVGMEWKEHVAWIAPLLVTAVAAVLAAYGPEIARRDELRRACLVLISAAFVAAATAGFIGVMLNKYAPVL